MNGMTIFSFSDVKMRSNFKNIDESKQTDNSVYWKSNKLSSKLNVNANSNANVGANDYKIIKQKF